MRRMGRNRSRPRPRMCVTWAKSMSTFFVSFIEMSYWRVLAPLMHVNMHCWAVDVAGDPAGVFVFFATDLAGIGVGAAFGF